MTTQNSELRVQNSPRRAGVCGGCACAVGVWNGRHDWLLCANYPGHEGELTHVSGTGIVVDCRRFCRKWDSARAAPPAAGEEVRYIDLGQGRVAIVDAADYEWLSKYRWRAFGKSDGPYAYCRVGQKAIFMHRLIMNPPPGKVVDHINGNRQDNRRGNLRVCTPAENARNSRKRRGASRFKGVTWCSKLRKWEAKIGHNGKTKHLGWFQDEIEAAQAYDRAARKLFGQFAYLNFPDFGNIVRLSGRVTAHSRVRARIRVLKSEAATEARRTNIQILSDYRNPNALTIETRRPPLRSFRVPSVGHLDPSTRSGQILFRISGTTPGIRHLPPAELSNFAPQILPPRRAPPAQWAQSVLSRHATRRPAPCRVLQVNTVLRQKALREASTRRTGGATASLN